MCFYLARWALKNLHFILIGEKWESKPLTTELRTYRC